MPSTKLPSHSEIDGRRPLRSRRTVLGGALAAATLTSSADRDSGQADLVDGSPRNNRREGLSGINRHDAARRLSEAIRHAAPGAVVDASGLRGEVHLSEDPFAEILSAPIILRTGNVTFTYDFNAGAIQLPSGLEWQLNGTILRPILPIIAIPSDSSPAAAILQTRVVGGTADGAAGDRTIIVDYPAGIAPGCLLAILGGEVSGSVTHRLDASLSASDLYLQLHGAADTLGNSTAYIGIGSEVVLAHFDSYGNANIEQRGAFGSPIEFHPEGASAVLRGSFVAAVSEVNGRKITLDRPLPMSIKKATFRCGAIDSKISGVGLIDGRGPAPGSDGVWHCFASTLGRRIRVSGELSLKGGAHGGLMLFGTRDSEIELKSVSDCGRPAQGLGASIWIFGDCRNNRVAVGDVSKGALAVAIDNKSYGSTYVGLEGSPVRNTVQIDTVVDHTTLYDISGASENVIRVGMADAPSPSVIHSGTPQTTSGTRTRDNRITIGNLDAQPEPIGDSTEGNSITQM